MQEVKREVLVSKASELLKNGTVDRVLGWKAGEFDYDITPAVFHTSEELEQDFVWNDFCGANFSKYLVSETGKSENKILVFLKPCDTYSFNQLIKEHPEYGNIICRCEMITEGEILDAIHRPLGARSLDGVKRRTRAGMGRCQSGFCSPKVMEILEREVPMPVDKIGKNGVGSEFIVGENKELEEVK